MKKRTRTNLQILASVVCGMFLLAGCGQKGPLFIPEPEQQTQPEEASPAMPAEQTQQES
ncbi:LPS translocon maturation chaperone LptM [Idiomarina sp. A28L]|uniref:LPS translocon maturation chaperone LptM n=1 Tax=Idiomarina sp. A28L TaxID=1036674 RepID=UPI0009FE266E|nr:lipoprotein [Idiomarina sp. A28L]